MSKQQVMHRALLVATLLLAAPAWAPPVLADEQTVTLKPGAGADVVNANCGGCHSLDYIEMNSAFLGADGWKAEVAKMRSAFGAPIDDADAAAIQTYLAETYGPAK